MPRGRQPKLTPEIQDMVLQAILIGGTYELASMYAGLHRTTVWRWLKKGEADPDSKYTEFAAAVRAAEGKGATQCLAAIRSAAKDSWQAAAWLLERRFGDQYGRQHLDVRAHGKIEHEHTGNLGFDVSRLSTEELKSLEQIFSRLDEEARPDPEADADDPAGGAGAPEPA